MCDIDKASVPQANRWRKRGINMMPIRWGMAWAGVPYSVHLSVFRGDGTVAIVHGGVEVGQGINTKVSDMYVYRSLYEGGGSNLPPRR